MPLLVSMLSSKMVVLLGSEVILMLDFVNTNLFKNGETIRVMIYSDNREKSFNMFNYLIDGEKVVEQKESFRQLKAVIEKDGVNISVETVPLSLNSRGYRNQYALIDKSIIGHKYGEELFHHLIQPANMFYSHLIKEDVKVPKTTMMLF